ncbi:MAG: hypothetical protein ACLSVD_13885, partial [Eggerthellaceae bacterium]
MAPPYLWSMFGFEPMGRPASLGRGHEAEAGRTFMARGTHDGKPKKGGLFDDLSIAQVLAGALAAVTSMLLASQIGIYGSVIGVGVGSVVSAVASQLYKKFLQASADKIQELKPGETGFMRGAGGGSESAPGEAPQGPAGGSEGSSAPDAAAPAEVPAQLDPARTARLEGAATRRSPTPRVDDDRLRGDAALERAQERRAHKRKLQRGVVIVAVVSALLAVGASAFVIDFATTGQGVGEKTAPLIRPSSDEKAPQADEASS